MKNESQEEKDWMTVEEWNKTTTWMPVIVPEYLIKRAHELKELSDENLQRLEQGHVVKVAGYWSVLSRNLTAVHS